MRKIMSPLLSVCLMAGTAMADVQKVSVANNQFGSHLYQAVRKSENNKKQNRFISPVSAYLALSMLASGARNETEQAVLATIHSTGMSKEELNQSNRSLIDTLTRKSENEKQTEIRFANSVWTDQSFRLRDRYIQTLKDSYDSEARSLDFSDEKSADVINGWVEEKTNGKIKKLLQTTKGEAFYLINTTYFKGPWTHPFDKSWTKEDKFYVSANEIKQVPMMQNRHFGYYTEGQGYQAASLEYGYGDSRMIVILPKDIVDFESKVSSELLSQISQTLDSHESFRDLTVKMPRFKFDYKADLEAPLQDMGMGIAFGPTADFFDLASGGVRITKALQKTFLAVDEIGTEAAAATVIGGVTSVPSAPKASLTLNRPFFVAIEDRETKAILFMGSIVNP